MALEKWLYDLVDEKKTIDSYVEYILENNTSVALAGVLCSLVKKYPNLLCGKLKVLVSAWQYLIWDVKISLDDSWGIGFDLYCRKLGADLYNKALQWNRMPHRKNILKDIVQHHLQYAVGYNVDVTYFDAVAQTWGKQNDPTGLLSPFLIAQLMPANYKKSDCPEEKLRLASHIRYLLRKS